MAEELNVPDQPDGIEETSFDLPAVEKAAERVGEYLGWWGDGLIDAAGPNAGHPAAPLYARDLQALVNAARDQAMLLRLHAEAVWTSENRLEVGDRLGWRLIEAHEEISRLQRQLEFEMYGGDNFSEADARAAGATPERQPGVGGTPCDECTDGQTSFIELHIGHGIPSMVPDLAGDEPSEVPQCAVHPDGPELATPDAWCKRLSIHVLDPDGWRRDRKPWADPITEDEFRRRAAWSTQAPWAPSASSVHPDGETA